MKYRLDKFNKRLNLISNLFSSLLFAILLTMGILYLLGCQMIVVLGESSYPFLRYHDLIVVQKTDVQSLEVGDYVTRGIEGFYVTHKVVDVWEEDGVFYFDTQGYGNNTTDAGTGPGFTQKDLVGKVIFKSKVLGRTIAYFQGYTNIGNMLTTHANRNTGIIRIVEVLVAYMAVIKFASYYKFHEDFELDLSQD